MAQPEQTPHTPVALVKLAHGFLEKNGVENPRLEAEILLAHVLDIKRIDIYVNFDKPLSKAEIDGYRELMVRRAKGEPTAYILGKREFWSLEFRVTPDVLIPRPDTERLVEAALEKMGEGGRLLDIGVGSGAIAIALLSEKPGWSGVGLDISREAIAVAVHNAEVNGVAERLELVNSDLFDKAVGEFDLIVTNPPYIPTGELEELDVARTEPVSALDGGGDGLDIIRRIVEEAPAHLRAGGVFCVEFALGQAPEVETILAHGGFNSIDIIKDYAGIERLATAVKAE